jgi:hypothetical protein
MLNPKCSIAGICIKLMYAMVHINGLLAQYADGSKFRSQPGQHSELNICLYFCLKTLLY